MNQTLCQFLPAAESCSAAGDSMQGPGLSASPKTAPPKMWAEMPNP